MKNYKIADFPEMNSFGNVMKVKRTDYIKQQEKYKSDPTAFMNSQRGSGGINPPRNRNGGGNQNPADMRKRMEERVKEEAKNNSNPIELK
jgi:hypothetical protein